MASAGSIVARDDTLLGICFAIGEDFGFNPIFLRLPFALALLWSAPVAVAAYLALGIPVAISRWLAPEPRIAEADSADVPEPVDELPLAA